MPLRFSGNLILYRILSLCEGDAPRQQAADWQKWASSAAGRYAVAGGGICVGCEGHRAGAQIRRYIVRTARKGVLFEEEMFFRPAQSIAEGPREAFCRNRMELTEGVAAVASVVFSSLAVRSTARNTATTKRGPPGRPTTCAEQPNTLARKAISPTRSPVAKKLGRFARRVEDCHAPSSRNKTSRPPMSRNANCQFAD